VPAAVLVLLLLGINLPFGFLEPYSLLVSKSLLYAGPSLLLAAAVLLAAARGRTFCRTFCPAGLVLRILAAASPFHLKIDPDKCLGCGQCTRICRASCADGRSRTLDRSGCLLCLDCLAVCPNESLTWGRIRVPASPGRRPFLKQFLAGLFLGAAWRTPAAWRARLNGRPAAAAVLPPGALSLAHLNAHCSLCHSCLRICPNQALVPGPAWDLALKDRPVIDAYQGFCQYDCTLCTRVCPTGALTVLETEEKHLARLGLVLLDRRECVVVKNGTSCGACAELCPTGAVSMAPGPSGRDEPTVDEKYCIGCGACQKACPVRPVSAVRVEGFLIQQTAVLPIREETEDTHLSEEFPF
jgi:ferredoxin